MSVFFGVLPVVPTPFSEDGSVDLDSLRNVVSHAIDCGVSALVYPGVASEDVQLSPAERILCVQTVVEAASARAQVIGGVNCVDAAEMAMLAGVMKEEGVQGIMAMAVPSMAEKGFNYWFQSLAEATGGLPIILQNLFAPRGAGLDAGEMLDIARNVEAVRYVKEECIPSGPTVTALVAGSDGFLDGVIGGGGARYLFEELERGAIATMPAIELLELHVTLMAAYATGNRDAAAALYRSSLPILLMQAPYRMRLTKLILRHRGIIACDKVREDLPELDDVSRALIVEMYEYIQPAREAAIARSH